MIDGNSVIYESNRFKTPGVDYGSSNPTVVSISFSTNFVAVHFQGHSSWVGRGTTGYFPAETVLASFDSAVLAGSKIILRNCKAVLTLESSRAKNLELVKEKIERAYPTLKEK